MHAVGSCIMLMLLKKLDLQLHLKHTLPNRSHMLPRELALQSISDALPRKIESSQVLNTHSAGNWIFGHFTNTFLMELGLHPSFKYTLLRSWYFGQVSNKQTLGNWTFIHVWSMQSLEALPLVVLLNYLMMSKEKRQQYRVSDLILSVRLILQRFSHRV